MPCPSAAAGAILLVCTSQNVQPRVHHCLAMVHISPTLAGCCKHAVTSARAGSRSQARSKQHHTLRFTHGSALSGYTVSDAVTHLYRVGSNNQPVLHPSIQRLWLASPNSWSHVLSPAMILYRPCKSSLHLSTTGETDAGRLTKLASCRFVVAGAARLPPSTEEQAVLARPV